MDLRTSEASRTGAFSIHAQPDGLLLRTVLALVRPGLESLLGLSRLNQMYAAAAEHRGGRPFCDLAIEALQITPHARPDPAERVPATGPLIIIANHPFGGADGLVLQSLISRVRPDVKSMGNFLLAQIPDLRESTIFVDPFDRPGRAAQNARGVREAVRWVTNGGALVIFPAGEVSSIRRNDRLAEDALWQDSVTRLIRTCAAPVLPVFVEGVNSAWFYGLGPLHPLLRTAMLPRELLRQQRRDVTIHFGRVIAPKQLERLDIRDATAYLRMRTYAVGARVLQPPPPPSIPSSPMPLESAHASPARRPARTSPSTAPAIASAHTPRTRLVDAMSALVAQADLVDHDRFSIIATTGDEVPGLLDEIGRARAVTFEAVQEGSGTDIDRDAFDEYYTQLVLWDRERGVVAGGYRLGATDRILPMHGLRGLYTQTLFRFDRRLFDRLGPALELGRSFVLPAYQKDFAPLMLLWKGIGRLIAQHGVHRHLFGAVSISRQYSEVARAVVSGYLNASHAMPGWRGVAVPRNPPRFGKVVHHALFRDLARLSVSDLDEIIREIEQGQRGLPVLLRQYLSLNARALGMNVDSAFGDVLDALMLLDLRAVPAPMLARFVGADAAAAIGQKPLRESA